MLCSAGLNAERYRCSGNLTVRMCTWSESTSVWPVLKDSCSAGLTVEQCSTDRTIQVFSWFYSTGVKLI